MPLKLSAHDPGRPADRHMVGDSRGPEQLRLRGADRQLADRARAGRRVGASRPWNYPLHQIVGQGRAGAGRRLHGGAQAERGRPAQRLHPRRGHRGGRRCRPGCSTSSPASGRWSGRRSPRTPTSTWSASPAPPGPASGWRELAADTVKRVALELGGKSANVILDDADLAKAVTAGVGKCYLNSGQTCTRPDPHARPARPLAEAEQIAAATAEAFTPGDPFAEATTPRAAGLRRPAGPGPGLHREGRSTRAPSSSPAAPRRPTASTGATSSGPPSSPT